MWALPWIVVLFVASLVAVAILVDRTSNPKLSTQDPRARAVLENPEYRWTDVLRSHQSEIRFDPEKRVMCLLSVHSAPRIVAFSDIRAWAYNVLPYRNTQTSYTYRFQITTNNPANPITFLDIHAPNNSAAEMWVAKMTAYING